VSNQVSTRWCRIGVNQVAPRCQPGGNHVVNQVINQVANLVSKQESTRGLIRWQPSVNQVATRW
jgi:hypothetical protein